MAHGVWIWDIILHDFTNEDFMNATRDTDKAMDKS